jgi:hypothetical protein
MLRALPILFRLMDSDFKACFPWCLPVVYMRDARHERPFVRSATAPSAPRGAADVLRTRSEGRRRFARVPHSPEPSGGVGYKTTMGMGQTRRLERPWTTARTAAVDVGAPASYGP